MWLGPERPWGGVALGNKDVRKLTSRRRNMSAKRWFDCKLCSHHPVVYRAATVPSAVLSSQQNSAESGSPRVQVSIVRCSAIHQIIIHKRRNPIYLSASTQACIPLMARTPHCAVDAAKACMLSAGESTPCLTGRREGSRRQVVHDPSGSATASGISWRRGQGGLRGLGGCKGAGGTTEHDAHAWWRAGAGRVAGAGGVQQPALVIAVSPSASKAQTQEVAGGLRHQTPSFGTGVGWRRGCCAQLRSRFLGAAAIAAVPCAT